jgi:2-polyprenyl-3-methyl-5-hydroxy-6-metoxy-1,4-benzoquinol methylase
MLHDYLDTRDHMTDALRRLCWCGDSKFAAFSDEYQFCSNCGTLVSQVGLDSDQLLVGDDNRDFYGKEYWLSHQGRDLSQPDIYQRARQDIPERCLYWLRTLLAYRVPPAKILELGSAHGGFVALARWAGYDASGQEMSKWVVDFARQTFNVPMLLGPLEDQRLPSQGFDAILLFDVLEHLDNPLLTLRHCAELLRHDGILIIQTPRFPDEKTYADLIAQRDPFLAHIERKAKEHLYLFSERAARRFSASLGLQEVCFEPPLFAYDMFFIATRVIRARVSQDAVDAVLTSSPSARLVGALLDRDDDRRISELNAHIGKLNQHIQSTSNDYEARLRVILEQQDQIRHLKQHLHEIDANRIVRALRRLKLL